MSSTLFKQFIKKAILSKQGAPGPPPRQGLVWKPQTHRWIRPKEVINPYAGHAEDAVNNAIYDSLKEKGLEGMDADELQDRIGEHLGDFAEQASSFGIDIEDEKAMDAFGTAVESYAKSESERIVSEAEGEDDDYEDDNTGGTYSPELAEQKKPELQQIMNDRVARAETDLSEYDIGQNMSTFDKLHNEVMLGDSEDFDGQSVFAQAGIDTENLSPEEEAHLYDFMDTITESAMEHNGIENTSAEDATSEDSDPDYDEEGDPIDTDPEGTSTHGHQNLLRRQREEAERKNAGQISSREKNISTDPDFAGGKYEKFVAGQSLPELFEVHGDDIMWEMEGSRGDPEAWIDERTELIVSRGSDESPKDIRNKVEEQFSENLVEYDVSSGNFPEMFDDEDEEDV